MESRKDTLNKHNGEMEYVQLTGRDTIHKKSCSYISGSKRKMIRIDLPENAKKVHFCKRCCAEFIPNPHSLVLDLEMCRVPGNSPFGYSHEIIQIGAVMMNEDFEVISEFSTYVHPEYSKVDRFITRLTGIEESNTKSAPLLKDAMKLFLDWLHHFKIENIYAWSDNDYNQFAYELNYKKLKNEAIEQLMNAEHWVDYQNIFGKRYGYDRAVSLEDALLYSEIDQAGRAHNGLDDAYNTAQLIEKLEKNPDYIPCVKSAAKKKEDMLTYSLGDLLGKLFQKTNQVAV